jgi:hypothetical protein
MSHSIFLYPGAAFAVVISTSVIEDFLLRPDVFNRLKTLEQCPELKVAQLPNAPFVSCRSSSKAVISPFVEDVGELRQEL